MSASSSGGRRHASLSSRRGDAEPASFTAVKMTVLAVALAGAAYGAYKLVSRLHSRWVAQYVVHDVKAPGVVEVHTTPHLTEEQIRDLFGLTNGCNLALIDFDEMRSEILRREPIIKSLSVTKRLPNSVSITAEERKPVVRVNYQVEVMKTADGRSRRHERWDVADSEGVVFRFSRKDSQLLPRIKGGPNPPVERGGRLTGKALAALRLVEVCSSKEFAGMNFDEIDISGASYLKAHFGAPTGEGNVLCVDWNFMGGADDDPTPRLKTAVQKVRQSIATRLPGPMCIYTVTDTDRVIVQSADKEPIR